jgi:carbamate kinase
VVPQVRVEADDPGFDRPDKPVGPHLADDALGRLAERTGAALETIGDGRCRIGPAVYAAVEDGRWRRVVASPRPRAVVEEAAVCRLLDRGIVAICAGGGGVPVTTGDGGLRGVEAVIDKDRTAALLTQVTGADALLILTDVDRVRAGYGTAAERPLDALGVTEARARLAAGEFPPGSMGPKVEAAADAADRGVTAVIAGLGQGATALAGRAGTRFDAG